MENGTSRLRAGLSLFINEVLLVALCCARACMALEKAHEVKMEKKRWSGPRLRLPDRGLQV